LLISKKTIGIAKKLLKQDKNTGNESYYIKEFNEFYNHCFTPTLSIIVWALIFEDKNFKVHEHLMGQ